jgi:hypothetical protein
MFFKKKSSLEERKKEYFGRVYDILVLHAGAREKDKHDFVYHHAEGKPYGGSNYGCSEYRFQGHLGFGGKYRSGSNMIDCYREDENEKILNIIDITNKKLEEVAKDFPDVWEMPLYMKMRKANLSI